MIGQESMQRRQAKFSEWYSRSELISRYHANKGRVEYYGFTDTWTSKMMAVSTTSDVLAAGQ